MPAVIFFIRVAKLYENVKCGAREKTVKNIVRRKNSEVE
jgi:hypothetical protein